MREAARATDKILRMLGGPFDRPSREMVQEYVRELLEARDRKKQQQDAALVDCRAELYVNDPKLHRILKSTADLLRSPA